MSISRPCLALVTNRTLLADADALTAAVESAVRGGVDLVIMREKDLPEVEQIVLATRLRIATEGQALLLISDSVSVALASGADGVQLGEASGAVGPVRAAADGTSLLVGRSVHDLPGTDQAIAAGADLLLLGNVFETGTHPGRKGAGLKLVERVSRRASVPVLGIGGVTAANAPTVMSMGAAGVAVITAILATPNPEHASRELAAAISAVPAMGGDA